MSAAAARPGVLARREPMTATDRVSCAVSRLPRTGSRTVVDGAQVLRVPVVQDREELEALAAPAIDVSPGAAEQGPRVLGEEASPGPAGGQLLMQHGDGAAGALHRLRAVGPRAVPRRSRATSAARSRAELMIPGGSCSGERVGPLVRGLGRLVRELVPAVRRRARRGVAACDGLRLVRELVLARGGRRRGLLRARRGLRRGLVSELGARSS